MSLESAVQDLVVASNNLTAAVDGKITKIDARVEKEAVDFAAWRQAVQAKDINGRALYTQIIDLTGLSTNIYYPVWWRMPGNDEGVTEIVISRLFSRDAEKLPFGPGIYHIAGLNLQLEGCGWPWNGDANFLAVKRISQTYRETVRAIRFDMLCIPRHVTGTKPLYPQYTLGVASGSMQDSGCYLRGGMSYVVTKSFHDPVNVSRLDSEVLISQAVGEDNEIAFYVKPYQATDPLLGTTYPESRIAYTQDLDKRYALKGA
ncbi:phage tail protein [Pseudomonas wadenswilerensis]